MRIFTLVSGVILCQLVQLAFIVQVEAQEECGDVTCGANAKCKKQKKQAPRCACEAGFIGDGFNCVEACACSSHGDPHYIQYDNRKFDFQGDCSYLFSARDEVSKPECNFRAVVKNYKKDDTSDVSLTRSLTVTLGNTTVIKMGPGAELRVNGEVQDPSYSSHPDFKMAFYDRSQWLILKNCDILFGYGRHKATAFISKALGGNAYGLCGNCNGNDDDCKDSTGAQHNDGSGECNGLSVGQSWLVPNPSADPPETKDTCVVEDVKADCLEETLLEARTTYCDLVDITNTDSPWTVAYGSNEEYVAAANEAFDTCLMDVCVKLEEGGDAEELACNAMSDFVAQVEETIIDGSMPAWRSDERCPITCDEPNQQYFDALPCERSCANPENPTCPLGSVGGCGCMEGFYRSGQDCVPIEECGCQYRGSYYPIGERVMRKTCKEEYECQLVDGTPTMVKAQVFPGCLKTAECKLNEQGRYQCHCKKGMAGDGVTSCTAGCGPKDLLCGANSRCVQDKKTKEYSCQCNDGFSGDGEMCYEVCGCKHKGDPHTTPFDGGKTRHFQGNCTYLLTEMYDPAECKFVVWAKHQSSNKKAVSTTMEITVFVKGAKIFIGQGLTVLVNGLAVRGDVEFDDVTDYAIREEGSFVVVYTRCGSSVGFDGKTTVLIDVPKQYGEQLKGLCGNCNGKDDDFTTYDGEPVSPDTPNRYTAWGKTYQVNQANDEPYCQTGPTDDIGEEESCPPESAEAAAAAKACRKLRNPNGPFKDCLALGKKMSDRSAEIFGDCVFDYCAFNGDPVKQQSMLCEKMGEMSNECARESVVVNWRTDRFCPAAEDLGCKKANFLTYSPNVPACRKTCKYQKPRKKCRGKPSEGCECSRDDYVFDEDRCVPKSQCGCKYKNGYFPVGSTVVEKGCKKQRTCVHKKGRSKFKVKKMKGCNKKTESCELVDGGYKCQCKNGFEKKKGKCVESCGGKKCPKNAKCTKRKKCKCKRGFQWSDNKKKCERKAERCKCKASGDPHYTTYDKVIVHFMGVCRYTLSQFKDPKGKCSYHAIVQNEKRKGKEYPSFTQYLQVKYQSTNVVLHKDGPGKQRVVEVNGQFLPSLPYVVAGSFRIVDTGRWIVMETLGDCDYVFKFDGDKKAMVDVPKPKSLSDYSGLCGNCDSTDNDWVTRDGTSVAKLKGKARYVAYGNGWALPGPDGKIPEMCLAKRKEPRCTSKMQKRFKKKNACGVLSDKKGIFEKALKDKALKKMAKDYVETCMQDMCLTEGSEDEQNDLLCSAVEEFANAAKDVNEDLIGEWRSESFCPMTCGRHEEFRLNDDGCQTDCLGVTACLDSPEDGCFCKEGYVRSGRDCVKADECGCKMEIKEGGEDMTLYLRPGDEFVMPRSCVTKMCMKPDNGPAVMEDVEGKTVCNKETSKCKKTTKGYKCRCKSGFESEDGYNCVPVVAQIEEQEDIPPPPAPEDPGTDIEEPLPRGNNPSNPNRQHRDNNHNQDHLDHRETLQNQVNHQHHQHHQHQDNNHNQDQDHNRMNHHNNHNQEDHHNNHNQEDHHNNHNQDQDHNKNLQDPHLHKNLQDQGPHKNLQDPDLHKNLQDPDPHKNLQDQDPHKNLQDPDPHKNLQDQGPHKNLQDPDLHKNLQDPDPHKNLQDPDLHKNLLNPGLNKDQKVGLPQAGNQHQ